MLLKFRRAERVLEGALCAAALAMACGAPGAETDPGGGGEAGATGGFAGGGGGGSAGSVEMAGADSRSIGAPRRRISEPTAGSGGEPAEPEGSAGAVSEQAFVCIGDGEPPAKSSCGDGFRDAATEECDDGNPIANDGCDACRTRDLLPLAATSAPGTKARALGTGRHPLSAGCGGIALAYVETSDTLAPSVGVALFDRRGVARRVISDASPGALPAEDANPVTAELPDGTFALAFADFAGDGDELGIRLQRVSDAGPVGSATYATTALPGSQLDPDLLWIGGELWLSWVDTSNPATAPDVLIRSFDQSLVPTHDAWALGQSDAVEAGVALAPFGTTWAAAFRADMDGAERIEVRTGTKSWSIGPFPPGATGDRPALVALDAAHLFVVFTRGTDPGTTGIADVGRLRGALLDTAAPETIQEFAIAPLVAPYALDTTLEQVEPAALRVGDRVYVSWRSRTSADARGDELWLKELRFPPMGMTLNADLTLPEIPLPRSDGHRTGDQRGAVIAAVPLPVDGAIAAAWADFGPFGAVQGQTDVVMQLIPAPVRRSEGQP